MDSRTDFSEGILRAHSAAPDLSVVEEEQLVVREVDTGETRLFAKLRHPLAVSLSNRQINRCCEILLVIKATNYLSICHTAATYLDYIRSGDRF